jgi:hypothetical protein
MAIGPYDGAPQRRPQVRYVSQHVELPFKELKDFQNRRTQAYYKGLAASDALNNMANVNALTQDKALRNARVKEYEDRSTKMIEELEGDYSLAGKEIMGIGRDLKKELTSGRLGKISGNYNSAVAYEKDLKEKLDEGKIYLEKYKNLLNMSNVGYSGVEDEISDSYSSYNGIEAAEDIDLMAYADEHLEGWKADVFNTKQWGQTDDGRYWKLTGDKKEIVDEKELKVHALNAMRNDPKVRSFVDQEVQMAKFAAEQNGEPFDANTYRKQVFDQAASFGAAKNGYEKVQDVYTDIKEDGYELASYKKNLSKPSTHGAFGAEVKLIEENPYWENTDEFKQKLNGGMDNSLKASWDKAFTTLTGESTNTPQGKEAMNAAMSYYAEAIKEENPEFNPRSANGVSEIKDRMLKDLRQGIYPESLMGDSDISASDQLSLAKDIQSMTNAKNIIDNAHEEATKVAQKSTGYYLSTDDQIKADGEKFKVNPEEKFTVEGEEVSGTYKSAGYINPKGLEMNGKESLELASAIKHVNGGLFSSKTLGRWTVAPTKEGSENNKTAPLQGTDSLLEMAGKVFKGVANSKDKWRVTDNVTGKKYILDSNTGIPVVDDAIKNWKSNSSSKEKYQEKYDNFIETKERATTKQFATQDLGTYDVMNPQTNRIERIDLAEHTKDLGKFVVGQIDSFEFYSDDLAEKAEPFSSKVSQLYSEEEIAKGKADPVISDPLFVIAGATNGLSSETYMRYNISRKDKSKSLNIFLPLSKVSGVNNMGLKTSTMKMAIAVRKAMLAGGDGQDVYEPNSNLPIAEIRGGRVVLPNQGRGFKKNGERKDYVIPQGQEPQTLLAFTNGTLKR